MTWQDLWVALALVLVIEGILPFISPGTVRRTYIQIVQMDDRSLRIAGLASMVVGVVLLKLIA